MKNLKNHGLWSENDASRIEAIVGDLGQPRLGLSEADFEALSDSVDVFFHNGTPVPPSLILTLF